MREKFFFDPMSPPQGSRGTDIVMLEGYSRGTCSGKISAASVKWGREGKC